MNQVDQIITAVGPILKDYLSELANLRITVFREWPYLYDGDVSYEEKYLKRYLDSKRSVVFLAMDHGKIVGASSGLPIKEEIDQIKKPIEKAGWDIDRTFYFGESVLLPQYRGQGVGSQFFKLREEFAQKNVPNLLRCCFCSVSRPEDHPLKPKTYKSNASLWNKQGYTEHKEIVAQLEWKDINESEENFKPLIFWSKQF